ncbi:MAG: universal stress protein [Phycisphaerales bacterium]|nr:MAG: universal stress protein [Phycisphaerales bacterium]
MHRHILVALDGSDPSRCAGQAALALAAATKARVTACHVYGVGIHRVRFSDMEPGLPAEYQQEETLTDLRSAHDRLMDEGFRALSAGYVEDFLASSAEQGLAVESATVEGRSYVGILDLARQLEADLIAVGAYGLGAIGDHMLGGTATRVLRNAPCDVLVGRRTPTGGPILVGVDGSEKALQAATMAAGLGRAMNRDLHLSAIYDPDFHTHVFQTMAHSLSAQRQEEVGLAGQEKLHDEIINDGLGNLYAGFLAEAQRHVDSDGTTVTQHLLTGKAYAALNACASELDADLIVVSRYGHHREPCSRLGSNAEALIRTTPANVLLVGGVEVARRPVQPIKEVTATTPKRTAVAWDAEAEARLRRVPSFVRIMARRAVENAVRDSGRSTVSAADFDEVAAQFGMGRPRGDR